MIRVYVLDGPRVNDDNGAEIQFKSRKALEVIVWLVTHGGLSRDRKAMLADLWPDEPGGIALDYLRDHLYFARKGLSQASSEATIVTEGKGLRLTDRGLSSDWTEFWNLLDEAQSLSLEARCLQLTKASRLLSPSESASGFAPWFAPLLSKARRDFVAAALSAAASAEEQGHSDAALTALGLALAQDDSVAEAHDRRIRILAKLARKAADAPQAPEIPGSESRQRKRSRATLLIGTAAAFAICGAFLVRYWLSDPEGRLAEQLWAASYGPDEDSIIPAWRSGAGSLVAAMQSSIKARPHRTLAIGGAIYHFVDRFGLPAAERDRYQGLLEEAIRRCDGSVDPAMARALIADSFFRTLTRDPKRISQSIVEATRAEQVSRRCGDRWLEADSVRMQGYVDEPHRLERFLRALEMFRAQGSLKGEALCELCLGAQNMRYDDAIRASEMYAKLGNSWGFEFALNFARGYARAYDNDPSFDPYRGRLDDALVEHAKERHLARDTAGAYADLRDALRQAVLANDQGRAERDMFLVIATGDGNGDLDEALEPIYHRLGMRVHRNPDWPSEINKPLQVVPFSDPIAREELRTFVEQVMPTLR